MRNSKPAYLALYESLREEILSGVRPFGSRLPSRRVLARDRGVSAVTADHSIELLCEEGYAESRPRSGYFVVYREGDSFAPAVSDTAPHIAPTAPAAARDVFPFPSLAKVMRRVLSEYGEQILVRYALMLRDKGRRLDDMVRRLEVRRNQIRILALLDTLEYVKKGGRMGPAAAAFGTLLSIKPVLTLENGKLKVLGKARGSRMGNNLLNTEIGKTGIESRLPAAVAYSGLDHKKLDHYIEDSRPIWEGVLKDLPMSQLGSTIGTHAGPGTIVVAYFMKQ